jgi:hypothetical protein
VIGEDLDLLLENIIEGILDLLQGDIEEIILVVGQDHHKESRKPKPRKFTHISKSAKKCLTRMNVKFSGMGFNGLLKHKHKWKMICTNSNSENNLRSTLKRWPNLKQ